MQQGLSADTTEEQLGAASMDNAFGGGPGACDRDHLEQPNGTQQGPSGSPDGEAWRVEMTQDSLDDGWLQCCPFGGCSMGDKRVLCKTYDKAYKVCSARLSHCPEQPVLLHSESGCHCCAGPEQRSLSVYAHQACNVGGCCALA